MAALIPFIDLDNADEAQHGAANFLTARSRPPLVGRPLRAERPFRKAISAKAT